MARTTTKTTGSALFDRDLRYVIGTVDHPRRTIKRAPGQSVASLRAHRGSHIAVGVAMAALVATSAGFVLHTSSPDKALENSSTAISTATEAVAAPATTGNASSAGEKIADKLAASASSGSVAAKHIGVHTQSASKEDRSESTPTAPEAPASENTNASAIAPVQRTATSNEDDAPQVAQTTQQPDRDVASQTAIGGAGLYAPEDDLADSDPVINAILTPADSSLASTTAPWQRVVIKSGDTLSTIFQRAGFNANDAIRLVKNKQARLLKSLSPRSVLSLQATDEGAFGRLQYELTPERLLDIKTEGDSFVVDEIDREFDVRLREVTGTIASSLFVSASDIGLNQNVIMQMAEIFEYQIDFNLDIRRGDSYSIIFEEKWDGDHKVGTGEVVAAEFINKGQTYRAIRHVDDDNITRYYTPEGRSMRRAFLRSPVAFSRISSGFSKRRFHPILKRWRAHKGVDYAARRGTPVRATADGVVIERGNKGGYGRTVVIRHGQRYQTLYAHMSRYRKDVRKGTKVSQGQIIGYVGKSGWATGDHLHYEFRVDNKHTNPLTVKLPRAIAIDDRYLHEFLDDASLWSARLDVLNSNVAARDNDDNLSNPRS